MNDRPASPDHLTPGQLRARLRLLYAATANCGDGAGGFREGNTCGARRGDLGGSGPERRRARAFERLQRLRREGRPGSPSLNEVLQDQRSGRREHARDFRMQRRAIRKEMAADLREFDRDQARDLRDDEREAARGLAALDREHDREVAAIEKKRAKGERRGGESPEDFAARHDRMAARLAAQHRARRAEEEKAVADSRGEKVEGLAAARSRFLDEQLEAYRDRNREALDDLAGFYRDAREELAEHRRNQLEERREFATPRAFYAASPLGRLRLLYARERGSRSKTGDPKCTEAASKLASRKATSEDHRTLAECRAKTRTARKATQEREEGHEGKAQHLAHRARSQGPVSAKARAARAKELKDARRPVPPPSAEPSKRIIKLKRNPKTPERQAFDAAFRGMHDANRVLQQTVEAHGPYSDAAKSTAGYYKNKIEAAREAYRALKRSGRAPEAGTSGPAAGPEAPAAAPAAGKEPLTWGEKIGAPFTPFSNNTPRAPIDHDLVGHHEHYNFGTSNEHVAYTIANRNLRQARRKAEAAAEAFGADSPQARKFATERDTAQARFDEVSAPGYMAPEAERTADVIARLKGANAEASSAGPAPVPSPPASPPSGRLADLAGKPGTEASAKPKATRTPKPPAAPKPPKAVNPEKARAKVIEAMGAPGGMPLSTVELRQKTGLDKSAFDDAVNDLLESGHLNGHRHDFVQSLDDEDRAKLVPARHAGNDPQRTHFVILTRPKGTTSEAAAPAIKPKATRVVKPEAAPAPAPAAASPAPPSTSGHLGAIKAALPKIFGNREVDDRGLLLSTVARHAGLTPHQVVAALHPYVRTHDVDFDSPTQSTLDAADPEHLAQLPPHPDTGRPVDVVRFYRPHRLEPR